MEPRLHTEVHIHDARVRACAHDRTRWLEVRGPDDTWRCAAYLADDDTIRELARALLELLR